MCYSFYNALCEPIGDRNVKQLQEVIFNMENLVEQVVVKKKNFKYYLNIFLIIFIAIAIPVTIIVVAEVIKRGYLIYIALFLSLFCVYGAWFFITSLKVDFEYAVLGNILKIDKVIAKRRRSKILKTDIKAFEDFFRYSDEEMGKRKFTKVYDVAAESFSENNFVATFHSEARGKCALIFTPNEDTLKAMRPFFNPQIQKKIYTEKLI